MLRRLNARGPRVIQNEGRGSHVVHSLAEVRQIVPNVPNHDLFHAMIVYEGGELYTPDNISNMENKAFQAHQEFCKEGYSAGIQSCYAPDKGLCCIGRGLVTFDRIPPYIDKVCVGVLHNWDVGSEHREGDTLIMRYTEETHEECMPFATEFCSNINVTLQDTLTRLSTHESGIPADEKYDLGGCCGLLLSLLFHMFCQFLISGMQ